MEQEGLAPQETQDQVSAEEDAAMEAAFDEATSETAPAGKEVDDGEGSGEETIHEEAPGDAGKGEKADDGKGEKADGVLDAPGAQGPAADALKKLADEGKPTGEPERKADEPAKTQEIERPAAGTTWKRPLTGQDLDYFNTMVQDEDIPEGEIKIQGGTVNLREYMNDFPEVAQATRALSGLMVENTIRRAIHEGVLVTAEGLKAHRESLLQEVNKLLGGVQGKLAESDFWGELSDPTELNAEPIPGARRIARSPEFVEWFGKQPASIQAVGRSGVPSKVRAVFAAFKEFQAQEKAKAHDAGARMKKSEKVALLGSGARAPQQGGSRKITADPDDYEGAFNEAAGLV